MPKTSTRPRAHRTAEPSHDTRLAKALSHPLRMRLLARLNEGVASPKQMADEFGESVPLVAYHMRVLRELECVEVVKQVQRRGALETFYRPLMRAALPEDDFGSLPASVRQSLVGTILQETVKVNRAALEAGTLAADDDVHVTLTFLELDDKGWAKLNRRLAAVIDEAAELQAKAMASGKQPLRRTALAMQHFDRAPGPASR